MTRLTNDIQNIHEMFTSVLIYLFKDILLLIGIIVILLHFNREFALVSFSVLPLIFVTTLFFSHRARDAFREIRFKIAQMNAFFQENFSGIKVVQLFQREQEKRRRFQKINEEHYLANMKQISIYAFFVPLIEVLSSGAVGLLLWYGGGKVIQETITLGVLVAFLVLHPDVLSAHSRPFRKIHDPAVGDGFPGKDLSLLDHEERISEPSTPEAEGDQGTLNFSMSLSPMMEKRRS